ncbi:hypothetical protein FJY68_04920 [candidate division WOR-3 bacterium]|uniref:Uncharacterized protein n=1 Tax=candidate division WOR-3 bacterium TaxID=2052148 RepID=A0A937XHJ3_UNCW3|nr:hypothetical protein [candidate division WOR-3 bacterium]
MPTKLRLEAHRSLEVTLALLSPKLGCGLMLHSLPRLNASDPLHNSLANYGYENFFADKAAQKVIENSGLLKQFFDNAFTSKTPLRQNFRDVYGHLVVFMAIDAAAKTAWFVADPNNRVALENYYRDALSQGLKPLGVALLGSTVRLTPPGWQNLFDLLSDKFFYANPGVERVEIMGILDGARWRAPTLSLGVTLLNFRELPEVESAVKAAMRGSAGPQNRR